MDGLRERRRRHPLAPVLSSKSIDKAQAHHISVRRSHFCTLITLFALQFVTLIYFLFFRIIAHVSSSPTTAFLKHTGEDRQATNLLTGNSENDVPRSSKRQEPLDVIVTVYTYDRPRHLHRLLQDIADEGEKANLRIGVNVIDDNSLGCVFEPIGVNLFDSGEATKEAQSANNTDGVASSVWHLTAMYKTSDSFQKLAPCSARTRFQHIESFVRERSWDMYVSKYRHGRRRYWHLVRTAHSLLRAREAKYFVFLPDDDRLASNFFEKAISAWKSITDVRKATLMLHVEDSREHGPVWTNVKPRIYGDGIFRIGWVESGNFLCTRELLDLLNWSFPEISVSRWVKNPPISSGVGATLSELIHSSGLRMYRTEKSLVAHVGVTLSKMNFEFRKKSERALLTKYFADGDEAYEKLLQEAATVSASMASTWLRETALHAAVNSLAHQVDHLNVYLNGYDIVPGFLLQPYISVVQSQGKGSKGDIGDIGKFYFCNDLNTEYHMTVDDDIIYPRNYVSALLAFRQSLKVPAIVGVHGIRISQESLVPSNPTIRGQGYYGSREVWLAGEEVVHRKTVHILGTGTVLYKVTDLGHVDVDNVFREPNMADIWFGGLAQKLKLPMVIMPRRKGWIREIPGTFEDSIYRRHTKRRSSHRVQTAVAKSFVPWILHNP